VAIFLDGVPLNETDGYADTNVIIPLEIDHVDVIKGPSSVLYGNYASGGAVSYYTIKSGDFTRLRLNYGSFNTVDTSGVLARSGEKLDQVYAFQVYHTDGYRANSDWDKQNVAARWTYRPTEKLSATLGLRSFHSEWDSAGYVPDYFSPKDWVNDGSGQGNGGKKKRFEARLDVNYELNDDSKLMFYTWANDQDFTRYYVNYMPYAPDGTRNSGDERFHQREVWGLGTSYNLDGQIGGRDFVFVAGVDFSRESENRERWNLKWGTGRQRHEKFRDYKYFLNTLSVYGEANYQILEPLKVRVGGRYDKFTGDLNVKMQKNTGTLADTLQPGSYDSKGYHAFSPKFGLLYTPMENLELYANFGRGFQLPNSDTAFFTDPTQKISYRDQYEFGFRTSPLSWLSLGGSYYRLYTDNDLYTNPATNESENIGKTLRTGLETYADFFFATDWRFHLDYSYQDAKYKKWAASGLDMAGRRLTAVPRHITNLELNYEPEEGLGGRARFSWNADRVLRDQPGTAPVYGQDYGTLDLQLNYRFNEQYLVTLDVKNALDKEYYGSQGVYSPANGYFTYSPQNPLTVYVGLEINWD
jgi:iron complex outermembrane receptor protein